MQLRQAIGVAFLLVGLGFGGAYVASEPGAREALRPLTSLVPLPGCAIKGNISISGGERIYHVPGQRYYAETTISPQYGERWFCSEAEARAAGWRRSRG